MTHAPGRKPAPPSTPDLLARIDALRAKAMAKQLVREQARPRPQARPAWSGSNPHMVERDGE